MSVGKCIFHTVIACDKFSGQAELCRHVGELADAGIRGFYVNLSGLDWQRAITVCRSIKTRLPEDASLSIIAATEDIVRIALSLHTCGVYLKEGCDVEQLRLNFKERIQIGCAYNPKVLACSINYFGLPIYPRGDGVGSGFLWGVERLNLLRGLTNKPIRMLTTRMYAPCLAPLICGGDGLIVTDLQDPEDAKKLCEDMSAWDNRYIKSTLA